jgi:hypothetical protein
LKNPQSGKNQKLVFETETSVLDIFRKIHQYSKFCKVVKKSFFLISVRIFSDYSSSQFLRMLILLHQTMQKFDFPSEFFYLGKMTYLSHSEVEEKMNIVPM